MAYVDEVAQICLDAQAVRLRGSIAASQATVAANRLRRSLVERRSLMLWSTELDSDMKFMSGTRRATKRCPER